MSIPSPNPPLTCDHGLRRQAIVEALLDDLVRGRLRPGGRLAARALAVRFGVSLTPVREALISLAGIGIVDLLPNRGAVVRRLTPREIRELCQVRCMLEGGAARAACGRIDRAELEELSGAMLRLVEVRPPVPGGIVEEAQALDSRLHDAIARSCDNAMLAREIDRLKVVSRAFRDVTWGYDTARNDYHRVAIAAREHLEIIRALLAEDRREAARSMARHIRSGMSYWCRMLPEADPGATPGPRSRRGRVAEKPR